MEKQQDPPDPYFILRGHRYFINSICFDRTNDNLLFSGSGDGELRLWNIEDKRCLKVVQHAHPEGGVFSLHSVPGQNALVSQGRDGTVKVWTLDQSGLTLLNKLETNSISLGKCSPLVTNISSIINAPPRSTEPALPNLDSLSLGTNNNNNMPAINAIENLVAISSDEVPSQIELWDMTRGECVMKVRADLSTAGMPGSSQNIGERFGMAMCMKLWRDTDGRLKLCSGFENGGMCLWDLSNPQQCLAMSKLSTEPLLSFALNGDCGVSGSGDDRIVEFKINYESRQFDKIVDHKLNNNGIADVKIRDDGKIFATAGWDRRVRIFNARKHTPLAILKYHTESIYSIDFNRQNVLASASKDLKIALWSIYK
ncbi:hypothetical protein SAMD00019534_002700 [Acytostelium subglobosum LB1]|uniref:hypothetical protein n=1 Tax=Acytostelium subglobosum LB1 TaxID=1410327 RepID=UPI000644E468|nr:hypothetical protein SAMD00019534_002700 [Acytostelium subglobosum LB1]GAM17095.1 hypothetical protein SAMD00019534_002700 [Acytostelium subglobosum LB1]|eukprot:XP_012759157.1 hypothetical protein SAMD00019534_002700 [Acytostelium subglobosum LB1]